MQSRRWHNNSIAVIPPSPLNDKDKVKDTFYMKKMFIALLIGLRKGGFKV